VVNVHIHQFKPGGAVVDAAAAGWCELGREAGFAQARQVFVDPTTSSACSASTSAPQRHERRRWRIGGRPHDQSRGMLNSVRARIL
jgi:hypothetical protein